MAEKDSASPEKVNFYTISIRGGDKERNIRLSSGMFRFAVASVIIGGLLLIGTGAYSFYSTMKMQRDALTIQEIEQAAELRQEQLLTLSKKAATLSETIQNLAQQEQELRIQAGLNPPKEDKPPEGQPSTENPQPEENPAPENNLTPEQKIHSIIGKFKGNSATENNLTPEQKIHSIVGKFKTTPANTDQPAVNESAENPAVNSNEDTEQRIRSIIDEFKEEDYNGQGGPLGELDISEVSEALDILEAKVSTRKESLDGFQTELKQQREQLAIGAAVASGYSPNFESYTAPIPSGSVQFDFANGLPIIPAAGSIPAPGSFPFDPSLVGGSGAADSHIPSIWPTTGVVSSPYGLRWGGTDFHPGMDIANDMGTPIVATADGIVEYAGWNSGGYGNMVDINHGNGIMTRYGHAAQVVVSVGQHVKRGQLIAYMGSTGFSTGPHVHYEVHVNGNRVNPISYL